MKKQIYTGLAALALCSAGLISRGGGVTPKAFAAMQQVDVNDPHFANTKNQLIINPLQESHVTSVQQISGPAPSVLTDNWDTSLGGFGNGGHFNKPIPGGATVAFWYAGTPIDPNTNVRFNYDQIGTYNGEPITASIDFFNIKRGLSDPNDSSTTSYILQSTAEYQAPPARNLKSSEFTKPEDFKNLLSQGFWYNAIQSADVTIHFYTQDGKEVNLSGNSYMTFNSMNPSEVSNLGEYARYARMNSQPYYVRKDTVLKEYSGPLSYDRKVVGGKGLNDADLSEGVLWNTHNDLLGNPEFTKASVSFQLSGTSNTFTVGSGRAFGYNAQWFTLNSATLWTVNPDKPTKEVNDDKGNDINKQEVQLGQVVSYKLDQKIDVLGQDILSKYQSMEFVDQLDKRLSFKDATLSDTLGRSWKASDVGTVKVDADNKLTYTLNKDFLENTLAYNGEELTLSINTTVNDISFDTTIKNVGHVNIDNRDQVTNEVDNEVPKLDNKVVKHVYNAKNEEISSKALEPGQTYHYNVDVSFDNKTGVTHSILDDLDDRLDLKGVKIVEGGKDITSIGKLTIDDNKESFNWTTSQNVGNKSVQAQIEFVVNESKISSDEEVKNIAHVLSGTKDTPSNEVPNTINSYGHVVIQKLDTATGQAVKGAQYVISDTKANMEAGKYIRESNGKIFFPGDAGYDTAKDYIGTTDDKGNSRFNHLDLFRNNKLTFFVKEIKSTSTHQLDPVIHQVTATRDNAADVTNNVKDSQRVMPTTGGSTILFAIGGAVSLIGLLGFVIYKISSKSKEVK